MAAECGGAGPPDPIVVGYVEPNLPFWRKMGEHSPGHPTNPATERLYDR